MLRFYKPYTIEQVRANSALYNNGVDTRNYSQGCVYIANRGYTYLDEYGLMIVPSFFTQARPFENGLGVVQTEGKWGIINKRGNWVLDPSYAQISNSYYNTHLPFYLVQPSHSKDFYIFTTKSHTLSPQLLDTLSINGNSYLIGFHGQWGAVDNDGTMAVPVKYDFVTGNVEGYYAVKKGNRMGLFHSGDSEPVVPLLYDSVAVCTPTTFLYRQNGRYGLLNQQAGVLLESIYDTLYFHHNDEWIVTGRDTVYCLRNTKRLDVPPIEYLQIRKEVERMTVVQSYNGYGVLNSNGEEVMPTMYDYIRDYSNKVAVIRHENEYGVVNTDGQFLIPFSLSLVNIGDFFQERALAAQYNLMESRMLMQYGYIDKKGRTVIPFIFDNAHERFSEGRAGVCYKGYWGFIDTLGAEVVPFRYSSVLPFSQGKAYVCDQDGWTVIEKD